MKRPLFIALSVSILFNFAGFNAVKAADNPAEAEKTLNLADVFRTRYLLGGDTSDVKDRGEAIYLAKGDVKDALITLKDILIEHKSPPRTFTNRDRINIVIFRGILPNSGQIELIKVAYKGNSFEVYAKYVDIFDPNLPSEPAAIIPIGKFPKGKYNVALYVDNKLRKKAAFRVN